MIERVRHRVHRAERRVRDDPRVAEAVARFRLRRARTVGARPRVVGTPLLHTPEIRIGDDFLCWSVHRRTHLGGTGRIDIGDRVFLNSGVVVLAFDRIVLEDDVALASEVFVTDSDNHPLGDRPLHQAPTVIRRGAWVATRAIVLAGVEVGARAVVAAGAVVTSDVPPDTLVAGVPARPVRTIEYPPGARSAWRDDP